METLLDVMEALSKEYHRIATIFGPMHIVITVLQNMNMRGLFDSGEYIRMQTKGDSQRNKTIKDGGVASQQS